MDRLPDLRMLAASMSRHSPQSAELVGWAAARLEEQDALILSLANRLAAASECLGKAAERGKVVLQKEVVG